jgi:maleylpyruvate isomerase
VDAVPDLMSQIDEATRRLLGTVKGLSDDDVRAPSRLPGWTRGHVLTHLARGAEALTNVLHGARTGEPTRAYASQQARDEAIERGAGRSAEDLLADVTAGAEKFRAAVAIVPDDAWERQVRVLDYAEFPALQLLTRRLVEVELHHTDLGAGYGPDDWPARFAGMDLDEPMRTQRADRKR